MARCFQGILMLGFSQFFYATYQKAFYLSIENIFLFAHA